METEEEKEELEIKRRDKHGGGGMCGKGGRQDPGKGPCLDLIG